jgi:predicted lipoprotein with Yx(FWY)xxD motif
MAVKGISLLVVTLVAAACGSAAAAPRPTPTPVRPVLSEVSNGTLGQILVDAKGYTLYFFVPEQGAKVVCTGDCATMWHPLLATGTAPPISTVPLPGVLATVDRPEGGRQVTYDGWPLYTYAKDGSPGETQGSGAAGEWFVALAAGESTPTPTPPPTPLPTAPPATPPPVPPPPPPTMRPPPFLNDGDADNRGGPNDGDGNK